MAMNALHDLVDFALGTGATISVWDGEEWGVKRSTNRAEILELVNDLDEAQLRIRDASGQSVGWALIVNGNAPDELVADWSITPFMEAWEARLANRAA